MDAIESLKDLLGNRPRLWALKIQTEHAPERHAWHVRLRLYHVARNHAANVSPECAEVLGLQYDARTNAIAFMARIVDPIDYHVIAKLSARLYGDEHRIEPHRME